jgi:hypothetical protein
VQTPVPPKKKEIIPTCQVAQGVGPEFKPQYNKKRGGVYSLILCPLFFKHHRLSWIVFPLTPQYANYYLNFI